MILIPWEYLKKYLHLSPIPSIDTVVQKLTVNGLETRFVFHEEEEYLEFVIPANRPDLFAWWGIVQEISILLNCLTKFPDFSTLNDECQENPVKVLFGNNKNLKINTVLIKNVKLSKTLPKEKKWLISSKVCPSNNNLVDLINLLSLETGQTFYVFDYDKIECRNELAIRQAKIGEKIFTRQGEELELDVTNTIIDSNKKIIFATKIGESQATNLDFQTKNVLLLCISSEEKDTLFLPIHHSLQWAIISISKLLNKEGKISIHFSSEESKRKEKTIIINHQFLEKKMGQKIAVEVFENLLKRLNFSFKKKVNSYLVKIPFHRSDIIKVEDLYEEIMRIYGYNKIDSYLPIWQCPPLSFDKNFREKKEQIYTFLANNGWQEVITYSLISESEFNQEKEFLSSPEQEYYKLLQPKNDNHCYYRQTLVPSHLNAIKHNIAHGNKNCLFFEISSVFSHVFEKTRQEELIVLSGTGKVFYQTITDELIQKVDLSWIKGTCENIFTLCFIEKEVSFKPYVSDSDTNIQVEIFLNQERIGYLGSSIDKKSEKTIFFCQISWTKIIKYLAKSPKNFFYKPVSYFPISEKDLSLILSENISHEDVIKEIKKSGGEYLQEVTLFDVYQNESLFSNKQKSLSFRLIFQSSQKTLEKNEVKNSMTKIEEKLSEIFTVKIR